VLCTLAATIAYVIVLAVAFSPEVQTIGADELVARSREARSFLIADYFYIVLYGVLTPLVIWRFARSAAGDPPPWMELAALLLAAAGLVDLTENTLLLFATGSVSPGAVDFAHALAVPKVVLFAGGALLALLAGLRAAMALRER
jgi:hypothetical protein